MVMSFCSSSHGLLSRFHRLPRHEESIDSATKKPLVASLLLVAMPFAPSSVLEFGRNK